VQLINRRLLEAAERHGNIVVVDADHALVDIPPSRRRDPKLWSYGRVAYSVDATRALARAFAEAWALSTRGPAKVLALDLDNTLWGGTYGEDGLERLTCGEDFPGNVFQAFQQECVRLKHQGLLLVALSKNNADAITVFERHAGMVLKRSDFAASAIDWQPKPENIRKLASELNLGLDSFVFIDDSPHEREAMRRLAPEVIVPCPDPAQPGWLRRLHAPGRVGSPRKTVAARSCMPPSGEPARSRPQPPLSRTILPGCSSSSRSAPLAVSPSRGLRKCTSGPINSISRHGG
jgi:HAD superfamily phosphatase (TIGR01681 family)